MKTLLQSLVKGKDCDYLEVRIEETDHQSILFTGHELDQVQKNKAYGGAIRALYKGGWGFVSFNSLNDLDAKVEMAIAQAKAIGNAINEKSMLSPANTIVDVVPLEVKLDIRSVSLDDKVVHMSIFASPEGFKGGSQISRMARYSRRSQNRVD